MLKLRLMVGLSAVLAVGVWAATASAVAPVPACSGPAGTALSGTYQNLTVTGNAYVAGNATLIVNGNLTVAEGACLDAFSMGTVSVGRNVLVGKGATLALGCTQTSIEPGQPTPCTGTTNDTVGGNIIAYQAFTMYLDGDHVSGDVISIGGGDPSLSKPWLAFPIKDNQIDGNLIVLGWQGAWVGAIRNTVGRNVMFSFNVGTRTSEDGTPDSTEIAANHIGGNLICLHNTPTARIGDVQFHTGPNIVGGKGIGECAAPGITQPAS
jgi:hypothetical protein